MTRGLDSRNPGDIRISPAHWLGKVTPSIDDAFETFDNIEHGIRAMAVLIMNYSLNDSCDTIRKVVTRYAPPSDSNPTDAYVNAVSQHTGFDPDCSLDFTIKDDLLPVVKAMCAFEQGEAIVAVTDEQFDAGVQMAFDTHAK